MFGLQTTLAPKMNGIHVGFPYITQFIFEKNAKRLADAAGSSARMSASRIKATASAEPKVEPAPKVEQPKPDQPAEDALLN